MSWVCSKIGVIFLSLYTCPLFQTHQMICFLLYNRNWGPWATDSCPHYHGHYQREHTVEALFWCMCVLPFVYLIFVNIYDNKHMPVSLSLCYSGNRVTYNHFSCVISSFQYHGVMVYAYNNRCQVHINKYSNYDVINYTLTRYAFRIMHCTIKTNTNVMPTLSIVYLRDIHERTPKLKCPAQYITWTKLKPGDGIKAIWLGVAQKAFHSANTFWSGNIFYLCLSKVLTN